jgi:hydroxymethylbilane synthase
MPDSIPQRPALRLGTRSSQLARWQADWVADQLRQLGRIVQLVEISTRGDVERTRPVEEIGTRGVFTKEIQRALLSGDVDLGVHSLKDLPTEPVDGLVLAAVPQRESAADVLVMRAGVAGVEPQRAPSGMPLGARRKLDPRHASALLSLLPNGARVGTGSLRRQAQLRHVRPDLQTADIRGNVDTRLRKLDDGQFDAIVLAEAGLRRLELGHRITGVLPFEVMLPAVGQGALAIECRAADAATRAAVSPLDDPTTHAAVLAERALLAQLRGGCMAPVGAWGRIVNGHLQLSAAVLSADGVEQVTAQDSAAENDLQAAAALGRRVADALLAQGAAELIAAART